MHIDIIGIYMLKETAPRVVSFHVINGEEFFSGQNRYRNRYLRGYVEFDDNQSGFFKMSPCVADQCEGLQRESEAVGFASFLGIPSVRLVHPYSESVQGFGSILFERLLETKGKLFRTNSDLNNADPDLGSRVAKLFHAYMVPVVPNDVDSSFLKRDDPRNMSARSFWNVWEDKLLCFQNRSLQYGLEFEGIRKEAADVQGELHEFVEEADNSTQEYFVHNDFVPKNMYFWNDPLERGDITVFDYDRAGATRNKVLAQITDISNFYRGCGLNNDMRMKFVTTLLDSTDEIYRVNMRKVLKTAMVFGVLQHVGNMKKDRFVLGHDERTESLDLLRTLRRNIRFLDTKEFS
jgi:hypothetical protein